MANEVTGLDFIVSVKAVGEVGEFIRIGGQRNCTHNRGRETIDAGNKDSGGQSVMLPTKRNWGISVDGVYQVGDLGLLAVETAYESEDSAILVELEYPNGDKYEGTATVSDFSIDGPWDGEAPYSIEFEQRGVLTKTPATP